MRNDRVFDALKDFFCQIKVKINYQLASVHINFSHWHYSIIINEPLAANYFDHFANTFVRRVSWLYHSQIVQFDS
jgi:hypothetical protein